RTRRHFVLVKRQQGPHDTRLSSVVAELNKRSRICALFNLTAKMIIRCWVVLGLLVAVGCSKPCCPGHNLFSIEEKQCDGYPEAVIQVNCTDSFFMLDPNLAKEDAFTINPQTGVLETNNKPPLLLQSEDYCTTRIVYEDGTITVQDIAVACFSDDKSSTSEPFYRFVLYSTCLVISAVFLLITLIVYLLVPELRDLQGKCLMFSMLSLCIAYISLAVLQLHSTTFNSNTCVSSAFFTYFWTLAAFFWLNIVSYNVWRSVIFHQFRVPDNQMFLWCCVYGWGGPLLFQIVALASHHLPEHNLIRPNFGVSTCWFHGPAEKWTYFYGPVAVLLICNFVFFVWTAWCLWKGCKDQSAPKLRCLRYKCLLYLKLFLVMGITWIFELMSFIVDSSSGFWFVTDLLNCLQGLIIFLILVVFRKKALRGLVKRRPFGFNCPKKWATGVDEESEGMLAEEEELSQTQIRT
ncbi:hypothetical protein L9F63_009528, partial [Diploptera punctata]